ncbi:MAG: quinolinate synthase NadA [Chloroflexi bacterium]|nr:quinolinate synthase NadA [Chloroflexota bacterium]MCI0804629.1 quinolinate synthase NadA [Chloroflexota bacterium]MCI0833160.1 quinolinate synthase NadA [Chloroflexota bacterium]MCI0836033.1 quinolinate synthase NadA [Chloroflexota bacterium]MCI0850852.1 quinolinate synthase NadA [Chloroflexota bacterium]
MTTALSKQTIVPITELEQSAFCQTDGNLRTKTLEEEFEAGVRWQKVPTRYLKLAPEEITEGIAFARKEIGEKAVVLAHHYQRDDVFQFADFTGDSYKLSKMAAAAKDAKWIIFCGVHFMAETADILTSPDQNVLLPNMAAGCSMSDMAKPSDLVDCWDELESVLGTADRVIPITYMNSAAAIKAHCGKNGGLVCTSSNADKAFEWAFERGDKILFLPDQHLGRNTGIAMGISPGDMAVWNPHLPMGGLSDAEIRQAKVLLWQGHCSVHTRFTVDQINAARERNPETNIIVHPECTQETVAAADMNGSTEFILNTVAGAPAGSSWGIGTEISMVRRLAANNPDKDVFCLDPVVCPCSTMYRIHPAYLLWVLEGIMAGLAINRIEVEPETRRNALIALERMLEVGG